ncbi:hypothetical protein M413DRAFT_439398 [Hebeloma cylindrosporum]|uniref:DASH complex subunit ASK1 n=1 Tax=Hebeloma cylindrosporum TaxID=76867 RepID=A0A0C3CV52_HEBCY|nr:hypothetical protein M413DRAFT_439398 [Hebeloma cylindrosporum h7]
MSSERKPITPNPPRWKPNPDPASIVIPGLDTEASTTDQIEQIEQLITIKLQNIDENFSKIHNVLANKLLPAVKRYAVGTEPVREAAKFWTSFYEQAAQIRIPTFDDYSTVNDVPSERDENESSSREHNSADDIPHDRTIRLAPEIQETSTSTVNSETSFLPGQGAFSSTPAIDRLASTNNDTFTTQNSDDPSWTTSMESPLVRLNREITNFSIHDNVVPSTSGSTLPPTQVQDESDYLSQEDTSIGIIPPSAKGKGKDTSHPLLKNVLRHNLYSASDNSSFDSQKVSPLKFRGKPKTPTIDKKLNPYLRPSDASGEGWSGVVDLRDPSMRTPDRYRSGKSFTAASGKTPKTPYTDDDDSFDGLPPGMSPPVLMSPARPPRSSAELGLLKIGQTPARDASARIQRDILRDVQLKSGGGKRLFRATSTHQYESSMSTVPTPHSLSRYNRQGHDYSSNSSITKDSSLESMIRRIRADLPSAEPAAYVGGTASAGAATTPGLRVRPRAQPSSQNAAQLRVPEPLNRYTDAESPITPAMLAPPPHQDYFEDDPITPVFNPLNEQDLDSDSDSLDEINNTAHPSAAFLMASQGGHGDFDDDSFGSNHSSDSLENELDHANIGLVPVHPFAADAVEDDGFDDDSFDDNRNGAYEETVFGVAPAQRQQSAAAQARLSNGEGLRMLGEDLLQDTIGIGSHIAATGRVEESPTPANWG